MMNNKVIHTHTVRNSYPAVRGLKRNVKFKTLKNVRQSNKTYRASGGKFKGKIGLRKQMTQDPALCIKKDFMGVRNNANRNEVLNQNVEAPKSCPEDAVGINNFLDSLPNSMVFSEKMEQDAIEFWKSKNDIKGFGDFLSVLSASGSNNQAIQKVKLALVLTQKLHDSYAENDTSNIDAIKKDVKFLVDNVNEYKLGFNSPIAGSSRKGFKALKSFDQFMDRISNQAELKGLDYNKEIHIMVMNEIKSLPDSHLRDVLHKEWENGPFRESIRVFEKMENVINSRSGFLRADALFSHQPIKLDLFKDYLKREGGPKKNDDTKEVPVKKEADAGKGNQGVTYIYNDYSTNINDFSKVIKGDRVNFKYNGDFIIKNNADKSKPQKETAFSSTEKTQSQHVGDIPETTARTSDITANSNKPSNETLTPPVTAGGQAGFDDIDGPALPRAASSTPDINAELNVRTSVQQVQPQIVGNPGSSMPAQQTSFIGPFSTGRTGAAQFQQYKQSPDSGRFDKKNESPSTPSHDAGTGIKSDGVHSRDKNVSNPNSHLTAGENPVSDRGANQALHAAPFARQRAQFATTLSKAKSNAALVQSSEPRSQEGVRPSIEPYIGPNRTGRTGAAEFKRYWQSANKTIAETDTLAGRREPLPGRDEKALLARLNPAGGENPGERDGSKGNVKANNVFETQPQKATTSPAQAMRQQPLSMDAAGISAQKSNIYMGPHRTGRTGAVDFKKYASNSDVSTVGNVLNGSGSIGRDVEPLAKAVSSSTIERRTVDKKDAVTPVTRGVEHAARVSQHKARVEPETSKVETTDDVLRADSASDSQRALFGQSSPGGIFGRKQVASSGENKTVTATGYAPYKGPFWTGRQGATAKQSYINTDGVTKK